MDYFLYGLIDGSYQHGINNNTSDIDIIEIYSSFINMEKELKKISNFDLNLIPQEQSNNFMKKFNIINWNPSRRIYTGEHFIYNLFYNNNYSYYRWLFPYHYLSDNEFTLEIKKINEDIVKENLPILYSQLINESNRLFQTGLQENYYKLKNYYKLIYKFFIDLIIIIEYYKTKSYKQSLQLGIYKPYILDIKNNFNNYSNFDFIVKRNELLNKISEIKNFYLNAPTNTKYQNQLIQKMENTNYSKFYI